MVKCTLVVSIIICTFFPRSSMFSALALYQILLYFHTFRWTSCDISEKICLSFNNLRIYIHGFCMLHPLLYRWRYVYFHVILPSYFSLSTVRLYSFFLRPFCNFLYVAQIDVRANLLKHMHLRTRHIEIKQSVAGLIVHVHLEFDEADSGPAKDMYKAHTHTYITSCKLVLLIDPHTHTMDSHSIVQVQLHVFIMRLFFSFVGVVSIVILVQMLWKLCL